MKDASTVISALGGSGAVARALKIAPQVVCNWAGRGSIPFEHHTKLLQMADALGVDLHRPGLEMLAAKRMKAPRKRAAA